MLNMNNLCIFDWETCNLNKDISSPIQIAAVMLHPRTLEEIEGSRFESLMRPIDPTKIEDKALEVNKKTREQIMAATEQKIVWKMFVDYLNTYNYKKSSFTAPIACGHNIFNFDLPIYRAMAVEYKNVDKRGEPNLFNPIYAIDTMQMCFTWFESLKNPEKLNLSAICTYLGMDPEEIAGAHDAMNDVLLTAAILRRFMQFGRNIAKTTKFKNAFKKEEAVVG